MKPEELHHIYAAEQEFWWYAGMRAITGALMSAAITGMGGDGLDAGCGTGYNALEFEKQSGLRMFGVDLAPLAIRYCHQRSFTRSLVGSVTELPIGDSQFDLVASFDVLCSLERGGEARGLEEFARVLRPGGWLVLRLPAFGVLRSRHSQFIAERQRFRASQLLPLFARNNLRLVRWTYANSFLSPVALLKFRVWEPLTRAKPQSGVDAMPPAWLNRLLTRVLRAEAALIRRGFRFPFGQSLMAVAQKPASPRNI